MRADRFYRSHRSTGFGPRWLIHKIALADSKLRRAFDLGSYHGAVTLLAWLAIIIVLVCSVVCLKTSAAYERNFLALRTETEKKFPRKKSLTDIRPAYNCLRKHLQQTDVFHEKTKKMLRKELLELEILNSRIKCIDKLVQSELQKLE
ncbi:uncharacterized protein LOC117218951 [Megalopta genalis]|uniref:uncharacterized protein LOC117218951 n=1 Tax=Megalopta genalis TaxID=115081 RepID=UPI003FD69681